MHACEVSPIFNILFIIVSLNNNIYGFFLRHKHIHYINLYTSCWTTYFNIQSVYASIVHNNITWNTCQRPHRAEQYSDCNRAHCVATARTHAICCARTIRFLYNILSWPFYIIVYLLSYYIVPYTNPRQYIHMRRRAKEGMKKKKKTNIASANTPCDNKKLCTSLLDDAFGSHKIYWINLN